MWFKKLLVSIWAYLPFFALTDDSWFLVGNFAQKEEHKYYFSIINILFGEIKIQFFSFPIGQPEMHFSVFRKIKLSEMENFRLSDEETEIKKNKYLEHYCSLSGETQAVEKEALMQHLNDEKARIETSYNKINAFTTIIVAVVPIAITFIDVDTIKGLTLVGDIIFILLIYAIVNLCAWIFQTISVRAFYKSSFKDLVGSKVEDIVNTYCGQIYYDWQQTKRKADMYVSFVSYAGKWIIAVILLTAFFSIGTQFMGDNNVAKTCECVYTIDATLIETAYEDSAIYWNRLLAELHQNKYTDVIILYSNAIKSENIHTIKSKLEHFRNQHTIWVEDDTLKENEIKVIIGVEK